LILALRLIPAAPCRYLAMVLRPMYAAPRKNLIVVPGRSLRRRSLCVAGT
jgi:hypothetical protein